MEFLLVTFNVERRKVILDTVNTDYETGETIEVEAGPHIVSLDGPQDFQPDQQEVILENTSELNPKEVIFEKTS